MSDTQQERLSYFSELNHQLLEIGNVTSAELATLVQHAPVTEHPACYNMVFRKSEGVVPGSYGNLILNDNIWGLKDVRYTTRLTTALNGGGLEELRVSIPTYEQGQEGTFSAGRAFKSFQPLVGELNQRGYEINTSGFSVLNFVGFSSNQRFAKFMAKTIEGKLAVLTREMVSGEPAKKLCLLYTSDVEQTPEFRGYKQILEDIKASRKVPF